MLCHPRSYTTEAASNVYRRPHMDGTSDMYWISAANLAMHHNLLSELAVGVLGSVFSALGDVSDNCVSHFMLFQVTFLVLSQYKELQFHADFDETLVGKFWSVIVPITLVADSIPELVVVCNHSQSPFQVKYHIEEAVVFGPDIVH
jgi:hypothetical protein